MGAGGDEMTPTIYRLADGVEVHLYPRWIENTEEAFRDAGKLSFSEEIVTMYGKPNVIRRRTVDYGLAYGYNKTAKPSIDWEPLGLDFRRRLEAQFQRDWPQCACNEYVDVNAYIGPHHDKATEVGGNKREPLFIASISLGGERKMVLTPPDANLKSVPITVNGLMAVPGAVGIDLPPGSLLMFSNSLNREWKHSIPKDQKGMAGKRISLTYRHFCE
jgi:alkylated DNA repair dioxygenase AlkB